MLLNKEFILEWRQRYALNGIILYVVSTVLICYLSFDVQQGGITVATWNALFWIIMLFTAVNSITKSFMQEASGRQLYYYNIASPQGIILSKILYNVLIMIVLGAICILVYATVLGNPVKNPLLFGLNLVFGALGFAASLTMVSGIAAKAGNNTTLMAILSFPVMVPMLLMMMQISNFAVLGMSFSAVLDSVFILLAIDAIVITLSFLLFPYLWRT